MDQSNSTIDLILARAKNVISGQRIVISDNKYMYLFHQVQFNAYFRPGSFLRIVALMIIGSMFGFFSMFTFGRWMLEKVGL